MKKHYGFTLIELLVVISILGVLFAFGSYSYTNQVKNARDQKRKANLELIRAQMEFFRSAKNTYPKNLSEYLTAGHTLPLDPKNNTITGIYSYTPSPVTCTTITPATVCSLYNLSTTLESGSTININPNSIL